MALMKIGISRIYMGAHWASDVLGAYLLGSLTLVAIVQLDCWGKARFFMHQNLSPKLKPHKHKHGRRNDNRRRPIPLLGEINTPQSMDAAGECLAYYKLTAVFRAWTKRVYES